MRRGLIAGVFVSAVPALILLSARDVEAQADAGANACVIDLAGAVYARLDCSTRMRPDLVDDTDASLAAGQLQIVLRAPDRSPSIIVSVHLSGIPHVGWQPHQLVAWVKSGSRTWDARRRGLVHAHADERAEDPCRWRHPLRAARKPRRNRARRLGRPRGGAQRELLITFVSAPRRRGTPSLRCRSRHRT